MKVMKRFFIGLMGLFMVFCFTGMGSNETSPGCGDDNTHVADVYISSSGISFSPKVNFEMIELRVSRSDGSVFSKTFESGSAPFIEYSDIIVSQFVDGVYTYELRVTPVADQRSRRGAKKEEEERMRPQKTLVQSGNFRIQDGRIVTPGASVEGLPDKPYDVLHYDDVIITGSLCVGFDCANGESFGYCTIKLKENNLQLCFEDTSVGAFPSNDWKIQINDTTSGGASYFTIWDTDGGRRPFTIEAGAPSHSLYVEDYGRVGLGTSVPYVELHIVDGDSPTVRLDQDGSSGWTPQRWDMCGNETNFFVRDVTNGSKLCFRIQPNTPSNTLCMRSDGNVGIGTWSPGANLEVEDTGSAVKLWLDRTDGATAEIIAKSNNITFGAKTNHGIQFSVNSASKMYLDTQGDVGIGVADPLYLLHLAGGAYCDGGAWVPGSSREYKENITDLRTEEAFEALEGLNPVRFNYKRNAEEDYIGFIAEDVPELVATKERKGVNTMDVVAVLTKVVQEQQKTISELKERIAELEKKAQTER